MRAASITGQPSDTLYAGSVQRGQRHDQRQPGQRRRHDVDEEPVPARWFSAARTAYAGGTSVEGGVLAISAAANLGSGQSHARRRHPADDRRRTLDAAVNLTDPAAGIDVPNPGDTTTLAGLVTGSGGLTKTGAGDLALTNTAGNNYSGDTERGGRHATGPGRQRLVAQQQRW